MGVNDAAAIFEKDWPGYLNKLKELVRIDSVSFEGFDPAKVSQSAKAVAEALEGVGLKNVEILRQGDAHPYVYGEDLSAGAGAPTLLLYAHHDVQPPGKVEAWRTEPFEPTEAEGPGGLRLYGRGAADDKAGILVHLASIGSFLKAGGLPVNVKVVIEGEEETGSAHLSEFLEAHRERLDADVMVLTDTMNYDVGVPALTVALRGMVGLDIEVKSVKNTLHSGMWGGPVPDPAMGLCQVFASMMGEDGEILVDGIRGYEVAAEVAAEIEGLPFDEARFREQCGMLDGVDVLKAGGHPLVQIWRRPSLTVNALQSSSRAQAGNTINDGAWGRVTVRLAPGMDAEAASASLQKWVRERLPWGLQCEFHVDVCAPGWSTDYRKPEHQWAFEAGRRSLEQGYGKAPVMMGCGGSIPFVQPFADALGGVPALLVGVEDPFTNAHGENESLCIEDLKRACLSQILLFQELASAWKGRK